LPDCHGWSKWNIVRKWYRTGRGGCCGVRYELTRTEVTSEYVCYLSDFNKNNFGPTYGGIYNHPSLDINWNCSSIHKKKNISIVQSFDTNNLDQPEHENSKWIFIS
jgi:hypothetical protein